MICSCKKWPLIGHLKIILTKGSPRCIFCEYSECVSREPQNSSFSYIISFHISCSFLLYLVKNVSDFFLISAHSSSSYTHTCLICVLRTVHLLMINITFNFWYWSDMLPSSKSVDMLQQWLICGLTCMCTGGGGHSHMSVDIKCLSVDPLFLRWSYTQRPPFLFGPHPMTPFFHFCIKFYIKIANFCMLRAHFEKFNDFVAILTENLQILPCNCIFTHWMTPILGVHTKKAPIFLVPTLNDPLFSTKSYTERPLFSFSGRHLYVTFIFEWPPGICTVCLVLKLNTFTLETVNFELLSQFWKTKISMKAD